MTTRSTFTTLTRLAAMLAAGMILFTAIDGAQARGHHSDHGAYGDRDHDRDRDRHRKGPVNTIHPIIYHPPTGPVHPVVPVTGIKAPVGTNAPVPTGGWGPGPVRDHRHCGGHGGSCGPY